MLCSSVSQKETFKGQMSTMLEPQKPIPRMVESYRNMLDWCGTIIVTMSKLCLTLRKPLKLLSEILMFWPLTRVFFGKRRKKSNDVTRPDIFFSLLSFYFLFFHNYPISNATSFLQRKSYFILLLNRVD